MIYKALNKIFGWDYVAWSNSADQGIARIHVSATGVPFYWRYKNIKVADFITKSSPLIWLTCIPSKYIKEEIK